MTKEALRIEYLNMRNSYTKEKLNKMNRDIFNQLIKLEQYVNAKTIFTYLSVNSEVDTIELIKHSWANNKTVCIPRTYKNRLMHFYSITDFNHLKKSKYGIFEPVEETVELPDNNSIFIIPAIVFDQDNYRIGYGGGFYDKYLFTYKVKNTIGIVYEGHIIDKIPIDNFDIPIDLVIQSKTGGI